MSAPVTALDKAKLAWGDKMPDWVEVLAKACDAENQKGVANRLGKSGALISQTLANKYGGDMEAVEQLVRGMLMAQTVDCPVVGELATDQCQTHQNAKYSGHNPQSVSFYKACRNNCPHSRIGGKNHAE